MGVKLAFPVLVAAVLNNIILAMINRMLSLPVVGLVLTSYMRGYILSFKVCKLGLRSYI